YELALAACTRSYELADRLELTNVTSLIRYQLALILARRGQLREARARIHELKDQGHLLRAWSVLLQLAQIEWLARRPRVCLKLLERMSSIMGSSTPKVYKAGTHGLRAHALLALGHTDEALAAAREGMALVHTTSHLEECEALVRLAMAEALHACGERNAARAAMAAARAYVVGRAKLINIPEWRRAFIEQVAENRRIMELADDWRDEPF
ncbi:MAG: hypothetical protein AAGC55_30895, partial [Myxococcota bacterium]